MEKVNQLHNKNNIKWKNIVDKTTKTFFLLSTLISASFIIVIVVFIAQKGIIPFISDNDELGSVNVLNSLPKEFGLMDQHLYQVYME